MPDKVKVDKFIHGGDYNPDQWLDHPEVIDRDFELFKEAGINSVTVGIFAWDKLEPSEGVYDFSWLDDVFDRAEKQGCKVILSTPSGARPRWMAEKYPEVLRVDENGRRNLYGTSQPLLHFTCLQAEGPGNQPQTCRTLRQA